MISHEEFERLLEKIAECTRQIELYPNDYMVYYNRGKTFRDLAYEGFHEYDENAIPDFDKTIELNPNYTEAYIHRGLSYYGLGQYERAIKDFDKAIELNPNDHRVYSIRGEAYCKLGQKKRGFQDMAMSSKLYGMYNDN